jgi:fatty acid desaturase
LLGRKAWFGPKRMGWGLSPVSPEGWTVTLVAIAAMVGLSLLTHDWWVVVPVAVVLVIVVFLKGTSLGGAQEWAEYKAQRDRRDA